MNPQSKRVAKIMNTVFDNSCKFLRNLILWRAAQCLALLPACIATGCIVVPVADLLKGPALEEQVLEEGAGVFSKEKVAIVDVSGIITGHEDTRLLSYTPNSVAETIARLNRIARDPEVKAVVLRIASPGGEVTACDIIHREVKRLKENKGVPVVACIMEQGASGGYYVACAADAIFAHPTSTVGSIGVIVQSFDLSALLEKIGVRVDPIMSSNKKDVNSIFRPHSEEEKKMLQKLVDDVFGRFKNVVAEGRPQIGREELEVLADGRILSGTEAAEVKLVDKVGYLEDAVEEACRRAHISSPTVVRYTRKAQLGSNIFTRQDSASPSAVDVSLRLQPGLWTAPKIYYLWRP